MILFLEACSGNFIFQIHLLTQGAHLEMSDDECIAEDDDGVGQAGAQKAEKDPYALAAWARCDASHSHYFCGNFSVAAFKCTRLQHKRLKKFK